VVFEGFFDHPTRGHIRIDNIHMSNNIELEQCAQPLPALTSGIPSKFCLLCICTSFANLSVLSA
ncbi:hypothetical protein GOODEAATRI_014794, partial [Goodea atripinnis]